MESWTVKDRAKQVANGMGYRKLIVGAIMAAGLFIAGCGAGQEVESEQSTTAVASSTAESATTSPVEETTTNSASSTTSENAEPEPVAPVSPAEHVASEPVAERRPVDCQMGFGPIVTTWSDGTMGGWSRMCQDVMDETVRSEAEANTPVCDGTICVYPSGATMPDPNAPGIPSDTSGAVCDDVQCTYPNGYVARIGDPNVPSYLKPGNSPWAQGQIDWMECLESGRTQEQCRVQLG